MAYTKIDFETKKALKEAVARWNDITNVHSQPVRCYQPGVGPSLYNYTGSLDLEGPHAPRPHKWYAAATLKDGIVIAVK